MFACSGMIGVVTNLMARPSNLIHQPTNLIGRRLFMNRIAIAVISPVLVLFSFVTIGSAYAQNPNVVSDDGGKTWHPYGESQSSSSSESSSSSTSSGGMSRAERIRQRD